jgi:uncharacterized protein YndB with AHSA1/START domain
VVIVARSIRIAAPRERVFALLADPLQRSRLNPTATPIRVEIESAPDDPTPAAPEPLRLGSVCHFRLQVNGHIVDYRMRVVEFEPNRRIVSLSDSAVPFETHLEILAEDGGTRLTHTERFEPSDEMLSGAEADNRYERALDFAYGMIALVDSDAARALRERREERLARQLEANLERWLEAIRWHLENDVSRGRAAP